MTYSHGQRELHCARVTTFLCAPTLRILFFRHTFWKKWPWIITSFLFPLRMIHCLLSLQLNPTLEYQKVKIALFSNKVIYLERTRITSLAKPGIWCFQVLREATFTFVLRGSSFLLGLTWPQSASLISALTLLFVSQLHNTLQSSTKPIRTTTAGTPLPDNHQFTKSTWHSAAEAQAHNNIIFPLPQGTNTVFAAAAAVQSFLTLGSLFSVLASPVKF